MICCCTRCDPGCSWGRATAKLALGCTYYPEFVLVFRRKQKQDLFGGMRPHACACRLITYGVYAWFVLGSGAYNAAAVKYNLDALCCVTKGSHIVEWSRSRCGPCALTSFQQFSSFPSYSVLLLPVPSHYVVKVQFSCPPASPSAASPYHLPRLLPGAAGSTIVSSLFAATSHQPAHKGVSDQQKHHLLLTLYRNVTSAGAQGFECERN